TQPAHGLRLAANGHLRAGGWPAFGPANRGQQHRKRAALSLLAMHRDLSLVRLGNPFAYRQPQATALLFAGARLIGTVETLEDMRARLGGDADARIGNAECRELAVAAHGDTDLAASMRVFDGVIDQ